jgi:hypothetical protein
MRQPARSSSASITFRHVAENVPKHNVSPAVQADELHEIRAILRRGVHDVAEC